MLISNLDATREGSFTTIIQELPLKMEIMPKQSKGTFSSLWNFTHISTSNPYSNIVFGKSSRLINLHDFANQSTNFRYSIVLIDL